MKLFQRYSIVKAGQLSMMRLFAVVDQVDRNQAGVNLGWDLKGVISGFDGNLGNVGGGQG